MAGTGQVEKPMTWSPGEGSFEEFTEGVGDCKLVGLAIVRIGLSGGMTVSYLL